MRHFILCAVIVLYCVGPVLADTFGTGDNQFTIDFVPISGNASSANGTKIGQFAPGNEWYMEFTAPGSDYRIGVYEITNDQWDKFRNELAVEVTGNPSDAYDSTSTFTGTSVPVNNVSWYEAAQMVNWLNTNTGHHVAYNFTGTQGDSGYALDTWPTTEAAGGTNLYRHREAFYFLPTENEWVKAAYFNGETLQYHATKAGDSIHRGDGTNGTGWNYTTMSGEHATDPPGPWDVGCGSEELNGTYDMMGNIFEWTESPSDGTTYDGDSEHGVRGGCWTIYDIALHSFVRGKTGPASEAHDLGFRVASVVPEPGSISLLACGAIGLLAYGYRRRKAA